MESPQPLMVILVGCMVGVVGIAIYLPILTMPALVK
jgi:type II secretory pathway component PulF